MNLEKEKDGQDEGLGFCILEKCSVTAELALLFCACLEAPEALLRLG